MNHNEKPDAALAPDPESPLQPFPWETEEALPPPLSAALEAYGYKLNEARKRLLWDTVCQRSRHFALVLEDLKDPHNISAVVRTSEVFGFQDVHIIGEVNPYRVAPTILKGSYKWLDLFVYRRRARCFQEIKKRGYAVAVASTAATQSLYDLDLTKPTAFYLGSESMGNHPDTLAAADIHFRIPQVGLTESMNVSVCAGVLVAHLDAFLRREGRDRYGLSARDKAELLAVFFERSALGVGRQSPVHHVD